MAKYIGLAIKPYNDLEVTADGNLRLVTDAEAIGQHTRQRISFFKGEWFLDLDVGLDWFGKVLGGMNVLIFGLWVRDVNCGMKVMQREIWNTIRPTYGVEKLFNTEMFWRLKLAHIPWKYVDVPHYARMAGSPTGGSIRVIARMFKEMWDLRRKMS